MKKYIHAGRVGSVGLFIINFISAVSFFGGVSAVLFGVLFGAFAPVASAMMIAPHLCCSSVLFIPGVEGSRLYTSGIFSENQLWEPNRNADVEKLYLDSNGKSLNQSIYTRDIIKTTNYHFLDIDVYKAFSDSMGALVSSGSISAWQALPYDWRLDYNDIIINGTKTSNLFTATSSVIQAIKDLAQSSKTGSVSIVAHSNGGLLAKAIIEELKREGESWLVDKLILVAVPQLGTPQSISAMLHGYGQSLFHDIILSSSVARTLSENMPTAYNLLPSEKYMSQSTAPLITFDSSIDSVSNLRKIYGDTVSDSATLNNFLLGTTDNRKKPSSSDLETPNILNNTLLANAKNVHQDLDNWTPPSGVAVTQIVGWGLDTVSGVKYQKKTVGHCEQFCVSTDILDYQPIMDFNGDGTVIRLSASALTAPTYYVNLAGINTSQNTNRSHMDILETSEAQTLVKNIVLGQQVLLPDNVVTSLPNHTGNSLQASTHSPVSISLYDALGNHTGLVNVSSSTSDLTFYEAKIPNSYYLPFGEGVYTGIENSATTTIAIQGTGVGTFTLNIDKVSDGVATSTVFEDLPVLPTTVATLVSSPAATSSLILDLNGDGKTDMTVVAGQDFDPIAYLKGMESVVTTFGLTKKVENQLDKKIDNLITLIQKGKIKKVNNKIGVFLKSAKLTKKHRKITTEDQDIIITMLNNLLDNIN